MCLASGSWESSMSYFEVAWLVPVILSGVRCGVMVKLGQAF